ncbi:MAG: glycosyltransferase [Patescibacteria group bacterium]|nr:glycosyltransferase [Patescibacteria group bacterium]
MDTKSLEIVMFNMSSFSEWEGGIVNRNYHIFNKLSQDEKVKRIIAVDFLPFTFKRALRNYLENILKTKNYKSNADIKVTNIYRDFTTKCVKIVGLAPAEIYVFSSIDSIFTRPNFLKKNLGGFSSHQIVIKKLNKILVKINKNQPEKTKRVIWSYFPMFVDYFSAQGRSASGGNGIPADLTVFDAVDNWIEHPSFARYKKLLEKNYEIIAQKSDLIFTVADNLVEFFKNLGRKKDVYWIANGVEPKHFAKEQSVLKNDPILMIPRPIIGYIGTIQNRVDFNLLEYLAQQNPEKSFVLIGPLWPVFLRKFRRPTTEIRKLKKYKNIHLLGRRPYDLTPAYIKFFDVAINPHKLDEFIKYTDSLKVLEYLACGMPVVTTPPSGVEKFSHLLYIAADYQDFNKNIETALAENQAELKEKRIQRIKEEDWDNKLLEMMNILKTKI